MNEVLNNLTHFRDHLTQSHGEQARVFPERTYKALLNRKTGALRFTQKITHLEHRMAPKGNKREVIEDWKPILIVVHQKTAADLARFEVSDSHHHALKPSELETMAWKVASATIDILNTKAKEQRGQNPNMLPEEAILQDLSAIRLPSQKDQIENLVGWMGSLSRIDAEKILTGKPVGTYLLREGDDITVSIAFHLTEENFISIRPYLLTVVEKDEKISDVLLLQTDKGWTLYEDDPNLEDSELYHFFDSPQALIHHLNQTARFPLC